MDMSSDINLLHYYIQSETGTSAFLATLFDQRFDHSIQEPFREFFRKKLLLEGVRVCGRPERVEVEYDCIDLVVLWDGWILLIENKIRSGSIRSGQLTEYYERTISNLSNGCFLDNPVYRDYKIAVVYITPTEQSGKGEFRSLQLDSQRADKKIHIAWSMILESCQMDNSLDIYDPFCFLVREGYNRTKLLIDHCQKPSAIYEDEYQTESRDCADKLRDKVSLWSREMGLTIQSWHSKLYSEQIWVTCQPDRIAYVTSYIWKRTANQPALRTTVSFEVKSKFRTSRKSDFDQSISRWKEGLKALNVDYNIDDKKLRVTTDRIWEHNDISIIIRELDLLMRGFVDIFSDFMLPAHYSQNAEQAGPGYPPQGVGSPDP